MKVNTKAILGTICGLVLGTGITYAATTYFADEVKYTKTTGEEVTVQSALNELYEKSDGNGSKEAVKVGTITTQGGNYTFQNDGYIIGTMKTTNKVGGKIFFNGENEENIKFYSPWDSSTTYNISLYAPKGTVVTTRSDAGNYNLELYEFI